MTVPDLFPDAPRRPSRPRRVLMHVVDAGDNGCKTKFKYFVHLECPKCGHDAGWWETDTKREAQTQPCPMCATGNAGCH